MYVFVRRYVQAITQDSANAKEVFSSFEKVAGDEKENFDQYIMRVSVFNVNSTQMTDTDSVTISLTDVNEIHFDRSAKSYIDIPTLGKNQDFSMNIKSDDWEVGETFGMIVVVDVFKYI